MLRLDHHPAPSNFPTWKKQARRRPSEWEDAHEHSPATPPHASVDSIRLGVWVVERSSNSTSTVTCQGDAHGTVSLAYQIVGSNGKSTATTHLDLTATLLTGDGYASLTCASINSQRRRCFHMTPLACASSYIYL